MAQFGWQRVVMLALFIGGGIGLIALGQAPLGATLIGAAAGGAIPSGAWNFAEKKKQPGNPPAPNGFARADLLGIAIVAIGLGGLIFAPHVRAITIQAEQNTYLHTTGGTKLNAVSCTAAAGLRWTGWINVTDQHSVAFDIDLILNGGAPVDLQYRCETAQNNAVIADAGRDLPIIVATAATGIQTVTFPAIWRFVAPGGGAPGTFSTTSRVSNIPAPFINCLFTCGAGAAAGDTITVLARGNNP